MLRKLYESLFHKKELKKLRELNKKLSNQIRLKALRLKDCEKALKRSLK